MKAKHFPRHRHAHQGQSQGGADAAGARDRAARQGVLPGRRAENFGRRLRRAAAAATRRSRQKFPELVQRRIAVAKSRRGAGARLCQGAARGADAVARQRVFRRRGRGIRRSGCGGSSISATRSRRSSPSRRSTGCRCRCATRTASWCAPPPAATALSARTSPPMSAPSRDIPHTLKGNRIPAVCEIARRGLHDSRAISWR